MAKDSIENTPRADDLLLSEDIDAFICTLHEDLRPMRGSAAIIDWRLKGLVSRFLRAGAITGCKSEITIIPFTRDGSQGRRRHALILLGLGQSHETILPQETKAILDSLRTRLVKLKVTRVAVSTSSFAFTTPSEIKKHLTANNKSLDLILST